MDRDSNWFVIATILLQTLIIILINNNIATSTDLGTLQDKIPYFNFFVLAISILNIVAIKKVEENAKYKMKALLFKNHLDQVENLLKSLRIQKHEYIRHMQTIQSLVELDRISETKDYIDGITKLNWINDDIYYMGHPALTGLINSKRSAAEI